MLIAVPIFILFLILYLRVKQGMFAAFLVLVATKSIMDAYWQYKIGPLSFSSVSAILIPIIFFPILTKIKYFPNFWSLSSKLLLVALSLGVVFALPFNLMPSAELVVLNLNIFMGFFIIPLLITTPKRFKKLLIAIMISGVFPMLISLYQFQTGVIFQERVTVGLTRYVGFYHDSFPVRFYGLITLFSSFLYLSLFKERNKLVYVGIGGLALGAIFSIYLIFSKAAIGILGLWVVLLLIFSKSRVKQIFAIGVGLSVMFLIFGDVLYANIEQMFVKEIGFQSGEVDDARYTLAGRGYIWEGYWQYWLTKQNTFYQLMGDGISRPAHNEFLRILLVSGVFGLVSFIAFIFTMIKNTFKINKRIKVYGFMLFGMFLIDCLGLTPGDYYYYNILVWGLIGLFIFNKFFIKQLVVKE